MGKFSEFELPLKSLPLGTHTFSYHIGKQFFVDMESADVRDADLSVLLTVKHDGEPYVLEFAVSGTVTVPCDRCLDDLVCPIEATYGVTVKLGKDYNDDSDEVLQIPATDPTLNVSYMICDTVVLAIPMKHIHAPGQCNRAMSAVLRRHRAAEPDGDILTDGEDGDMAECDSGSEPTDPRWEALKKLKDNEE